MSDYNKIGDKLGHQQVVNLIQDYAQIDSAESKKLGLLEERINTLIQDLKKSAGKEEGESLKRLAGRLDTLKTAKKAARDIKVSFELFRQMKAEQGQA